jgi:membrane associated rhomboid family serine protease
MLLPLRHESMTARRWPVFTMAIVALNVLAFLGTHWKLDDEGQQAGQVKVHLLILAATHPELRMPPDAQSFVDGFRDGNPRLWKQVQSLNRNPEDAWDTRIRLIDDPQVLQDEMDSLTQQYSQLEAVSIRDRYAFIPAHPRAISFLTANFLHAGWFHLVGNMWFLWLAGIILEDTWGRIIYPAFYLFAGAVALEIHAWANPGSIIATLGASGAVAALMGAFLVRYPNTKIDMMWLFWFRIYRFKAPAYSLLPVWALMEVFYGTLFGQGSGVAHWAHVGGFAFGAVVAVGLRYSGLEQKANDAIEEKVAWTGEGDVLEATELMGKGDLDQAVLLLEKHVATKPDSLDAYGLLKQLYWRKQNLPAHDQATIKLCQLCLKHQDPDGAWLNYEEFIHSGGEKLPASTWLELCRSAENQQNFERAVCEYEKLAAAYPAERQSLLAQMSAARLSLKKLNRPQEALAFYQAAAASSIPHLDWDATIQNGILEAQKAASVNLAPAESK